MGLHNHRQACDRCGGGPSRAVRTRSIAVHSEILYYLAYIWSCSVCGNSWIDDGLERLNAQAEQAARRGARQMRFPARRAS